MLVKEVQKARGDLDGRLERLMGVWGMLRLDVWAISSRE